MTLQEIADIYHVSRQRIEQIIRCSSAKHEHIHIGSERAEKRAIAMGKTRRKEAEENRKKLILSNLHLSTWELAKLAGYTARKSVYFGIKKWTGKTLKEVRAEFKHQ